MTRLLDYAKNVKGVSTPFLVLDPTVIAANYVAFAGAFNASLSPYHVPYVYYAIKANPHPAYLCALADLGCCFDAASVNEIKSVFDIDRFYPKHRISYGNTVKKSEDIKRALKLGIRTFAVDSVEEVEKIAAITRGMPNADVGVYCRIETDGKGADWALGHKFGTTPHNAVTVLACAKALGLIPLGVSFHVGSNQKDPQAWVRALENTKKVFDECDKLDIHLTVINVGSGFPAFSVDNGDWIEVYSKTIAHSLIDLFGYSTPLKIMFEPGRALAASSGVVATEVILNTATRIENSRWLTIDAGVFSGFVECVEEAIKYPIDTDKDATADCFAEYNIAGQTCDSMDILYQKHHPVLPVDLNEGDRLYFKNAGCYFSTYATTGFNGFKPPKIIVI